MNFPHHLNNVLARSATAVFSWMTAVMPSSASETVRCEPLPDFVPSLEDMKSELASGNYETFFSFVGRIAKGSRADNSTSDSPSEILSRVFPDGFDACINLKSDRVSERWISEIFMLEDQVDDEAKVLFFGWDAINFGDEWKIAGYLLSDDFEVIRKNWD